MIIPETALAVLSEARTMRLATIGADGAPNVAAFWFHFDGAKIYFASVENATVRNLRHDPRVAVVVDVGERIDALRSVTIKGTAIAYPPREAPPAVKRAIRAIDERSADEVRSPAYQAYLRHERRAPVLVEVSIERVNWFELAEPQRRELEGC